MRLRERHDGVELVAPGLEVDGVDDGAARDALERGLITSGSVESIWIGAGCVSETRFYDLAHLLASSWRSVSATQMSSTCAPPVTWSSAIWRMPS